MTRNSKIVFITALTKSRVIKGYHYKMARDFSIDRLKGRMYTYTRYAFVCARTRTIVSDTQNCVKKKVNMRREGVLEMGRELDDAVAAAT